MFVVMLFFCGIVFCVLCGLDCCLGPCLWVCVFLSWFGVCSLFGFGLVLVPFWLVLSDCLFLGSVSSCLVVSFVVLGRGCVLVLVVGFLLWFSLFVFLVPMVAAGVGGECFSSLVCALGCWSCCCGSFELVLGVETLFVKYFYLIKVVNKGGHCA